MPDDRRNISLQSVFMFGVCVCGEAARLLREIDTREGSEAERGRCAVGVVGATGWQKISASPRRPQLLLQRMCS